MLYAHKGQAILKDSVLDTCTSNAEPSNLCPLLLRLADYLKMSIVDLVDPNDQHHLYSMCVEGQLQGCLSK